MPGSVSDPVRLDPFQNIIEVHWRSTPLAEINYLAFYTAGRGIHNAQHIDTPAGPYDLTDSIANIDSYLLNGFTTHQGTDYTNNTFLFTPQHYGYGIYGSSTGEVGSWGQLDIELFSVVMPAIANSVDVGIWTRSGQDAALSGWFIGAGTPTGKFVPTFIGPYKTQPEFNGSLTPEFRYPFTRFGDGGIPQKIRFTGGGVGSSVFYGVTGGRSIDNGPNTVLNMSGVTAGYDGETFAPVATAISSPLLTSNPNFHSILWLLYQKVE